MAKREIINEFVSKTGTHGIDGGSIDNLDFYTDEIVQRAILEAQNEFEDKKIKKRIASAINRWIGPRSTR